MTMPRCGVGRHAQALEPVALGIGGESDGLQHDIDGEGVRVGGAGPAVGEGDGVVGFGQPLDARTDQHGDAEVAIGLGDLFGDVDIFVGQHPLQAFDHGYRDAIIGQHIGEFDADRAGSDDGDRRRQLAGYDLFLVGAHPGWRRWR